MIAIANVLYPGSLRNCTSMAGYFNYRVEYEEKLGERPTNSYGILKSEVHHPFFPRTIREWNKVPTSLTGAPSLDLFKAHLGSTISLGHQF